MPALLKESMNEEPLCPLVCHGKHKSANSFQISASVNVSEPAVICFYLGSWSSAEDNTLFCR